MTESDGHVQVADVDAELKGTGGDDGLDLPTEQARFDVSASGEGEAAAVALDVLIAQFHPACPSSSTSTSSTGRRLVGIKAFVAQLLASQLQHDLAQLARAGEADYTQPLSQQGND